MNKSRVSGKRCPKCGCGNVDVKPTGNGHVVGVGQPHKEVNRFLYQCARCSTTFFPVPEKKNNELKKEK